MFKLKFGYNNTQNYLNRIEYWAIIMHPKMYQQVMIATIFTFSSLTHKIFILFALGVLHKWINITIW